MGQKINPASTSFRYRQRVARADKIRGTPQTTAVSESELPKDVEPPIEAYKEVPVVKSS